MPSPTALIPNGRRKGGVNRRVLLAVFTASALLLLIAIAAAGVMMPESAYAPRFSAKNLPPSQTHLFGTDWTGRDMFARTIKGLSISILIGTLASFISCIIALVLGISAATLGRWADTLISWLLDAMLGLPHAVLLILISFALGKGTFGVLIGVAVTHWPKLTRIVRAEILQIRSRQYILASRKLGLSIPRVAWIHIIPQVLPQFIISFILLFPHAIMHEASITFLGFGLPPEQPAIGVILSESLKYLMSDMWWLTFFPGISLIAIVLLFECIGENLRLLSDPNHGEE